jgi:hypothetical protein
MVLVDDDQWSKQSVWINPMKRFNVGVLAMANAVPLVDPESQWRTAAALKILPKAPSRL